MQNSHENFKQLQEALNARYSHGAWVSGSITELVYAKEISWSLSKRFHHSSIHAIHKYTERLIKFVKTLKVPEKQRHAFGLCVTLQLLVKQAVV